MLMKKFICFTLLFTFIPLSRSRICKLRISSNVTKDVCCADYEKIENDCIACSKGYTSYMGQNCKPCLKNTYGERCRYDCSCLDFEVCDNVEGCVNYSSTTGISVYETSVTFVQNTNGNTCGVNTDSGKIKKVCCADFEEKGKGCTACSKGYTSQMGQNCRPCPNNTYGEKCRYDCSCSRFEICDLVKGCVSIPSTTETSMYITTDDRTFKWTRRTGTNSENDSITLAWDLDARASGKSTDNSVGDLLSRKLITYLTLALIVFVIGICVCFIFYKYKIVGKMKKITIIHPQNPSLPQNKQDIEVEEGLYDTIGDTNMLRYVQQMLKATSSVSGESQIVRNHENISSLYEVHQETIHHCLNQPVIPLSPPKLKDYVTIATVHRIDSS